MMNSHGIPVFGIIAKVVKKLIICYFTLLDNNRISSSNLALKSIRRSFNSPAILTETMNCLEA